MKNDFVVQQVLLEVQQEIAEELEEEFSISELNEIVTSQFQAATYIMTKGFEVRLPMIGRFERKYVAEIIAGMIELRGLRDILSEEDLAAKHLEMKMAKIARNKIRRKNVVGVSLKELLVSPHNTNQVNKYKKLNEGVKVKLFGKDAKTQGGDTNY